MRTETKCFLAGILILVIMLAGSNYQMAEQRKQNKLVVQQSEHILITAKMLEDRQSELRRFLTAAEKQRLELLGLWEDIHPKYRQGPDEAVVMDDGE